ncbi:MAG: glycosyltransferase [Candidatus Omnitrophica bacterium]|nr:glycosyltransferase [Candidatus Omnitrophota bacterium]
MKKRLVILIDCISNLQAGAERQMLALSKSINNENFDLTLCSLESDGVSDKNLFVSNNIKFLTFPVKRIYGWSGFCQAFRFFKFLRKNKIEILMTVHFSSDIWGTLVGRMAGVKRIISNRRDLGFWRGKGHIKAYRFINQFVDKIVVNASASTRCFIFDELVPENKFLVIHNGVGIDKDIPVITRKELGLGEDEIVIVNVANLTPVKGHKNLIDAMSVVVSKYQNVKVLLVGEDRLNGQIQKSIEDKGLKKYFVYLGRHEYARSIIETADIGVLSSISEGLSNSIMEYMSAAKPVIATDVGGNSELVEENVTGLLVDKSNPAKLANAILQLIYDKSLRLKMGAAGQTKIKRDFTMERMVGAYEKLFLNP